MRILVAVSLTAVLGAQEVPIIRSTTRLVQVSVVVLAKDGKPATGLKLDDFRLTERGGPQRIAFFSAETKHNGTPVQLPANVFSNRATIRGSDAPSGVTVILLDMLNTAWTDQVYARDRVLRFLTHVRPEDRVGLYTLGRGLRVLHDFTTDTRALIRRLETMRGQQLPDFENSKTDPDIVRQLEENGLSTDSEKRIANFFQHNRIINTLRSFEAIASHLAGVPGRKNLIWVSGSFPLLITGNDLRTPGSGGRSFDIDQRAYLSELERTLRAMNQANVAVYPVDARGLVAPPTRIDTRGNPGVVVVPADNLETMMKIADRTGGKAYYNRNDIETAVREVFDESAITYTLGYYPEAAEPDGKWREIKVALNRPGLTVRHRRGYFALPEMGAVNETAVRNELRDAVWSPVDNTGIGINARVESSGEMWKVMLQIDPSTVTFTPAAERWTGRLDIAVVARSAEGVNLDATFDSLNMNLRRETYDNAIKSGILFETQLKRRPDAASLKIAVRDAPSGLTGTLNIPVGSLR
jgi:VWFA-related protein